MEPAREFHVQEFEPSFLIGLSCSQYAVVNEITFKNRNGDSVDIDWTMRVDGGYVVITDMCVLEATRLID